MELGDTAHIDHIGMMLQDSLACRCRGAQWVNLIESDWSHRDPKLEIDDRGSERTLRGDQSEKDAQWRGCCRADLLLLICASMEQVPAAAARHLRGWLPSCEVRWGITLTFPRVLLLLLLRMKMLEDV